MIHTYRNEICIFIKFICRYGETHDPHGEVVFRSLKLV